MSVPAFAFAAAAEIRFGCAGARVGACRSAAASVAVQANRVALDVVQSEELLERAR